MPDDSRRVIAETAHRRLLADGTVQLIELRPIPGVVGYAAGSDGYIYTFCKLRGRRRGYTRTPRRLKGWMTEWGYLTVTLRWCGKKSRRVHRLVASAFHGPCPDGMECSHLDGDTTHNEPGNLKWETPAENTRRQMVHGTFALGERNGRAVLSAEDVKAIRGRIGKETHRDIAADYGVNPATIGRIATGESWTSVT